MKDPVPTDEYIDIRHWKPRIVMMPTLPSLVTPQVVVTTYGLTSDGKVGIMPILDFQWMILVCSLLMYANDNVYITTSHENIRRLQ